jgi:hypothetical protein
MKTYRFKKVLKPWYRRWFSKEKEEWDVQLEQGPLELPNDVVIGSMDFSGSVVSYNVNVYEDGTSIIYQDEK